MARALRTLRGTVAVAAVTSPIRCGIYTRKSTTEGLAQGFTSLDNQRQAAEAYVTSQRHEGWEVLPDRYDDPGFSGGTADRPALKRLLADVEAGKIDCVVVYKYDRLSRSMLDFLQMLRFFEQHGVAFVSVTQQFNTTTPVGRMTMNILASFGEFERDIISERTRDKMHATRRRGKWTGGTPRLGYDVAPEGGKLLVNKQEAEQVKAIFGLYAENPSLVAVSQELNRRGWKRKSWTTRDGRCHEGGPWDVANLRRLLTDPLYAGMMPLGGETFPGEHEAIVPKALFQRVQAIMRENRRPRGVPVRNTHGALLRGLLRCARCDASMTHSWTRRSGRLHRYYVCGAAQKRGWSTCPTKSVSATEIEAFVIAQIKGIGKDPELRRATFRQALAQLAAQRRSLKAEMKRLTKDAAAARSEVDRLVGAAAKASGAASQALLDGLAKAQEKLTTVESRLREVRDQQASLEVLRINEEDLARALEAFDPIWDVLLTPEKERILRLLIEKIEFDGSKLSLGFRLPGVVTLASEIGATGKAS